MTDHPSDASESTSPPEQLLKKDLEPYIPNQSDGIIILGAYTKVSLLSIFALPVLAIAAIFTRKRKYVLYNLVHAFSYQSLGMLIAFFIWILWAFIIGGILRFIQGTHLSESHFYWFAILLAVIPSLFSAIWIAYSLLYAADIKRLQEKTSGHILYPFLTDWIDEKWEKLNIGLSRKKKDPISEGAFLIVQGGLRLELKKYDKAMEYYSRAIQIYREIKDKQREYEGLSTLFVAQNIAKEPIAMLDTLYLIANLAKEMGKDDEYEEAMRLIANTIDDEKDNEELVEHLTSLILEHSDDYILLYARANLYNSRGECERAYQDATRAYEIQPNDPNVLLTLGDSLENINLYEDEIRVFSKLIDLKPKTAKFYRYRAYAYLELNSMDQAKHDIEQAVQIEPRNATTRAMQGMLFLVEKNFTKAERYFQIAVNQADFVRFQFGLALAKLGLGNLDTASGIFSANLDKASILDLNFAHRWLDRLTPNLSISEEQIKTIRDLLQNKLMEKQQ